MFKINTKLVRTLIFERGLSLRQLAKAAGLNGLTVAKIVKDGATASIKTISKLAKFFGADANTLILDD